MASPVLCLLPLNLPPPPPPKKVASSFPPCSPWLFSCSTSFPLGLLHSILRQLQIENFRFSHHFHTELFTLHTSQLSLMPHTVAQLCIPVLPLRLSSLPPVLHLFLDSSPAILHILFLQGSFTLGVSSAVFLPALSMSHGLLYLPLLLPPSPALCSRSHPAGLLFTISSYVLCPLLHLLVITPSPSYLLSLPSAFSLRSLVSSFLHQ